MIELGKVTIHVDNGGYSFKVQKGECQENEPIMPHIVVEEDGYCMHSYTQLIFYEKVDATTLEQIGNMFLNAAKKLSDCPSEKQSKKMSRCVELIAEDFLVKACISEIEYCIGIDHYTYGKEPSASELAHLKALRSLSDEQRAAVDKLLKSCFEAAIDEGRSRQKFGENRNIGYTKKTKYRKNSPLA